MVTIHAIRVISAVRATLLNLDDGLRLNVGRVRQCRCRYHRDGGRAKQ